MAVTATLYYDDGFVGLMLNPIGNREKVGDDPIVPDYDTPGYLYYYWDAVKLEEQNVYDFIGIEVIDIGRLKDQDLEVMDSLNLPRVNVPEIGMVDTSVGDVLRWARAVYPSRYSATSA
jgi:hypothetical protein